MTDKEKAIVMAYTGICMLAGDKFRIFHKYVEDIMGRPVYTHEIGLLADTIKEKAEADFMALCADESSSENPNKWIPVSERLPEKTGLYLVSIGDLVCSKSFDGHNFRTESQVRFIPDAWMPLPEPYKEESEE